MRRKIRAVIIILILIFTVIAVTSQDIRMYFLDPDAYVSVEIEKGGG